MSWVEWRGNKEPGSEQPRKRSRCYPWPKDNAVVLSPMSSKDEKLEVFAYVAIYCIIKPSRRV